MSCFSQSLITFITNFSWTISKVSSSRVAEVLIPRHCLALTKSIGGKLFFLPPTVFLRLKHRGSKIMFLKMMIYTPLASFDHFASSLYCCLQGFHPHPLLYHSVLFWKKCHPLSASTDTDSIRKYAQYLTK